MLTNAQPILASMGIVKIKKMATYAFVNLDLVERIAMKIFTNAEVILASMEVVKIKLMTTLAIVNVDTLERIVKRLMIV